jgi:hypothetical protein
MADRDRDALLMRLFEAQQVGGVISDAAEPSGIDATSETYFQDPAELEVAYTQAGGARRRKQQRRTQRGGKRRGRGRRQNRSTFKLNLRAQIRLRSRSRTQRRH